MYLYLAISAEKKRKEKDAGERRGQREHHEDKVCDAEEEVEDARLVPQVAADVRVRAHVPCVVDLDAA